MSVTGKPAISPINALDLRAIAGAVSAARQRIEALEKAVNTLQTQVASLSSQSSSTSSGSGSGSGSVTSVRATVPDFLSVSGSPITSAGTLAFSLVSQTASTVFAGPVSGADAAPSFRALGWNFDIPLFSSMSFTSGLDGTEIIAIERYGSFYWTTLGDLAAIVSNPSFTWRSVSGDATLVDADAENGVSTSGTSGTQLITIPVGMAGNAVLVYQNGAAAAQVVPASGVNLRVRSGLSALLKGQYAVATLIRRAANEWFIAGDLSAGTNTSIAPGIGALTLTGRAPTAVRGTVRTPPVGAMVLAGLAPTVTVA